MKLPRLHSLVEIRADMQEKATEIACADTFRVYPDIPCRTIILQVPPFHKLRGDSLADGGIRRGLLKTLREVSCKFRLVLVLSIFSLGEMRQKQIVIFISPPTPPSLVKRGGQRVPNPLVLGHAGGQTFINLLFLQEGLLGEV